MDNLFFISNYIDNIYFQIPILVIGTKFDLISESNFIKSNVHRRSATIAEECGADEIFLVNII